MSEQAEQEHTEEQESQPTPEERREWRLAALVFIGSHSQSFRFVPGWYLLCHV